MKPERFGAFPFAFIFVAGTLSGCYGTKVGAPIYSPVPPPGISSTPAGPGGIAIPPDVQGALSVYRRQLIAQSHHLPHPAAEKYADAEILSLKTQYAGREPAMREEIVRRLERSERSSVPAASPAEKSGSAGYPLDTPTR